MKYKYMILILFLTTCLLCSCTSSSNSNSNKIMEYITTEETTLSMSENELQRDTKTTSQIISENTSEIDVEVGDGIYRVSTASNIEKVTTTYIYGTAKRSEGATIRVLGETVNFSAIPDDYNNDFIIYCVSAGDSTIYFADYFNFYKSDSELQSPTLLFSMGYDQNTLPSIITEMISFPNTDMLFFSGATKNGDCVGTINPENSKAEFIGCSRTMKPELCNTGVMLYDYKPSDTLLYWECGTIYEIPLNNPNECECGAYISANGKYACTFLWGKTEDSYLVERYSVYDTHNRKFIKSFDWTFNKKVGDQLPKGFSVIGISEENQCVYAHNTEDDQLYQFYFGG